MNKIELKAADLLKKAILNDKNLDLPELKKEAQGGFLSYSGRNGIILQENPLPPWEQFAVTVRFYPKSCGEEEQRFLHFGSITGPRFLFETRSHNGQWYLDVFLCGDDENKIVLMDKTKLHPENRWYTIRAEVYRNGVKAFVDGVPENEGIFSYVPFSGGGASVGVRQNLISYFNGYIDSIIIERLV